MLLAGLLALANVPAQAGMLDAIPGAQAAYSLRQLHDGYAGYAIEVRSSGGGTANIGFDANGQLDTTALLNAVGAGNDGFVTTWYDQVGSAHVVQDTEARQPQIVASGALISDPINHLPALRFSSSALNYEGNLSSETMSLFTAATWVSPPTSSSSNRQRLWTLRSDGSSRAAAGGDWGTTGGYPSAVSQFAVSYAAPGHTFDRTGTQIVRNEPFVTSYLYNASLYDETVPGSSDTLHLYLNGNLDHSRTSNLELNIGGVNHFTVGAHTHDDRLFNGLMQEMIVYQSILPPEDRTYIERSLMRYAPEPNSILFDFSTAGRTSPGNYNNVTGSTSTGTKIEDALNAKGAGTGIDLSVTQRFQGAVDYGDISSAAGFHENAQRDSFYVRGGSYDDAAVQLANLSPELLYDIVLFGSRTTVASDRYTVYTIGDVEQVLDTKANTSNVVTFSRVSPNSGGELDIGVRLLTNDDTALLEQLGIESTNTDHGYLSAMRLTAAGINYTTAGQAVSQNFNSLANTPNNSTHSWSDGITVPGWYFSRSDGSPATQYHVFDGSGPRQNALLSLGAPGDADRAVGFQTNDSSGEVHYGLRLVNTSGMTLDGFHLGYTGEQWRAVNSSDPSEIVFSYQVFDTGTGSLTEPSGWTEIPDLTFVAPHYHSSSGDNRPLDGRDPENRMELAGMAMDVPWGPGQELWLRWTDIHPPHQMMGINDVWFRAVPEPGSLLLLLAGAIVFLGRRPRPR